MKSIAIVVAGGALIGLSACASNRAQVLDLATGDLRCSADEIRIDLEARPYVGRTRYVADGCDKQRRYICQKKISVYGVAVGNANCELERS